MGLFDAPRSDQPSTCPLCDVLLGPFLVALGLVGLSTPIQIRLRRNEWILFASFWTTAVGVVAAIAWHV